MPQLHETSVPIGKAILDHANTNNYRLIELAELAVGVIGINDSYKDGDWELFFMMSMWSENRPQLISDDPRNTEPLKELNLGIVSGRNQARRPRTMRDLQVLALIALRRSDGASLTWHRDPIPLPFRLISVLLACFASFLIGQGCTKPIKPA